MNKAMTLVEQVNLLLEEDDLVHRIDNQHIPNFNSKLKTYHHSPDWSVSGRWNRRPKGILSSKGLFAGELKHVAPYAAPRGVRFITHNNNIVFHKDDQQAIRDHRPVLTSFSKEHFKSLGTGEHFSTNPGNPVHRQTIENPVSFMRKQGHKVSFVNDLDKYKKHLEDNNIPHNAEGFN